MGSERQPRCGFPMPSAKEPCARRQDHAGCHRIRYAMDNEYRRLMGREPDPWVERAGEWVAR